MLKAIKKPRLAWLLREYEFCYFLGFPSPSMIQRAENLVLSSILKAYLGSTFLVRPDSHWLTRLREELHRRANSAWLLIFSSSTMYLTRSAVVFTRLLECLLRSLWIIGNIGVILHKNSFFTKRTQFLALILQNGLILIWYEKGILQNEPIRELGYTHQGIPEGWFKPNANTENKITKQSQIPAKACQMCLSGIFLVITSCGRRYARF